MSKPAEIVQKGNESPSEFYKRLCEAYRYTPIDPEATGSQLRAREGAGCGSVGAVSGA